METEVSLDAKEAAMALTQLAAGPQLTLPPGPVHEEAVPSTPELLLSMKPCSVSLPRVETERQYRLLVLDAVKRCTEGLSSDSEDVSDESMLSDEDRGPQSTSLLSPLPPPPVPGADAFCPPAQRPILESLALPSAANSSFLGFSSSSSSGPSSFFMPKAAPPPQLPTPEVIADFQRLQAEAFSALYGGPRSGGDGMLQEGSGGVVGMEQGSVPMAEDKQVQRVVEEEVAEQDSPRSPSPEEAPQSPAAPEPEPKRKVKVSMIIILSVCFAFC